jgi:hypothetical protein
MKLIVFNADTATPNAIRPSDIEGVYVQGDGDGNNFTVIDTRQGFINTRESFESVVARINEALQ